MTLPSTSAHRPREATSGNHSPTENTPPARSSGVLEIVLATVRDGSRHQRDQRRADTSKPVHESGVGKSAILSMAWPASGGTRPGLRVCHLATGDTPESHRKDGQETPSNATHWSRAAIAEVMGISPSSVGRIWSEAGLKPHLTRVQGFERPDVRGKVTEIVGLYLDPPERAVVLCVDEKSQIRALDRTQPGLPLKKGVRPR